MIQAKTFRYGGLSLDRAAAWQPVSPILNAFLPASALVPLKQHAGPAARCVVRKGDVVREGQLIGKAEASEAAHVHSPVPGVVTDIRMIRVAAETPMEAVEIALRGTFDKLGKREERYLWTSLSRADLLQTMRDRGVVEMEPDGRPLAALVRERGSAKFLVLNALECEPYVRTETSLLAEKGKEVLEGFAILAELLGPALRVVALGPAESEGALEFAAMAKSAGAGIEAVHLMERYPQEMPNQLLSVMRLERQTPTPADAFIVRPSTTLALFEAIVLAKPVVERYVTVAGGAIKRPAVLKARLGTPIGDLIEECGGFVDAPERIVLGGPLRGIPVHNLDAPINKSTSAVLALTSAETNLHHVEPCIRCGRCSEVCPERLSPSDLFRRIERDRHEEAFALGLDSCSRCGACGYVCPSRIPLVDAFRQEQASRKATR
jgi:electron transport complex protein RnfC